MQNVITEAPVVEFAEVYRTLNGSVFQSDKENCWYIDFVGKLARFDYRSMMKLRKAIYAIDIEALLLNSEISPDLEIVFICACDHCYVLTLLEIIDFKTLLEGTFVMLELNRIIHDRVYRLSV
ncbi:MAG: hypothetical protein ABWY16_12590 [Pedobacter sp.]|uniref:hypothetical protein n=1 Tax=Pedobacter sp. TaxID=1411316 RepID=UPI003392F85B